MLPQDIDDFKQLILTWHQARYDYMQMHQDESTWIHTPEEIYFMQNEMANALYSQMKEHCLQKLNRPLDDLKASVKTDNDVIELMRAVESLIQDDLPDFLLDVLHRHINPVLVDVRQHLESIDPSQLSETQDSRIVFELALMSTWQDDGLIRRLLFDWVLKPNIPLWLFQMIQLYLIRLGDGGLIIQQDVLIALKNWLSAQTALSIDDDFAFSFSLYLDYAERMSVYKDQVDYQDAVILVGELFDQWMRFDRYRPISFHGLCLMNEPRYSDQLKHFMTQPQISKEDLQFCQSMLNLWSNQKEHTT